MLDKAFETLKTYDWGQDAKALLPIEQAINESHGDEAERAKLEKRIGESLASDISLDAKQMCCRYLRTCGTAASVPASTARAGSGGSSPSTCSAKKSTV